MPDNAPALHVNGIPVGPEIFSPHPALDQKISERTTAEAQRFLDAEETQAKHVPVLPLIDAVLKAQGQLGLKPLAQRRDAPPTSQELLEVLGAKPMGPQHRAEPGPRRIKKLDRANRVVRQFTHPSFTAPQTSLTLFELTQLIDVIAVQGIAINFRYQSGRYQVIEMTVESDRFNSLQVYGYEA